MKFNTVRTLSILLGAFFLLCAAFIIILSYFEIKTTWYLDWPYLAEMLTGVGTMLFGIGTFSALLFQWGYADAARKNEVLNDDLEKANDNLERANAELSESKSTLQNTNRTLEITSKKYREQSVKLAKVIENEQETNEVLEDTWQMLSDNLEQLEQTNIELEQAKAEAEELAMELAKHRRGQQYEINPIPDRPGLEGAFELVWDSDSQTIILTPNQARIIKGANAEASGKANVTGHSEDAAKLSKKPKGVGGKDFDSQK